MMTDTDATTAWHSILTTRLGDLTVVRDDEALIGLYFAHHWYPPQPESVGPRIDRGFDDLEAQLEEYFDGERREFDLALEPGGGGFQRQVWDLIAAIPYGETTTYGAIARSLDGGVIPQQVGAAVGRNPISILIPCHRVVGSTGKLTGYAGGLDRKRALLELEQPSLFNAEQPGLATAVH
jgi:methylated-DNA-[protein]-cysteine S-methyltransferase